MDGEKVFSNIFISIYVYGFGANRYEYTVDGNINKCSQGPYRAVLSAQGPGNSIFCIQEKF
jgi:hypothetical protein